jgi:hypothetical protein
VNRFNVVDDGTRQSLWPKKSGYFVLTFKQRFAQ